VSNIKAEGSGPTYTLEQLLSTPPMSKERVMRLIRLHGQRRVLLAQKRRDYSKWAGGNVARIRRIMQGRVVAPVPTGEVD
jgi:hypothetical protein